MKAAVVGAGVIGAGWAARFLLQGWDVAVYDPHPATGQRVERVLGNARRSLLALCGASLPTEGRLALCESLADAVVGANWIQESLPERLDLKQACYAEVQQHADEAAVLASSTSGFTPSALQEGALRPQQILVCHPFNPVYLLPLVEVVPSAQTDRALLEQCLDVLRRLGMQPLVVRHEIDAHIADRLLEALWREALWLVNDGVATTAEIDDAIRYGFGLRFAQMGLFETYRIAGGEAGMRHFLSQFGPALSWPWSRLTDVPELTQELVERIAAQSDAQSGHLTIDELERARDANLVAILSALRETGWGAGALLAKQNAVLPDAGSQKR